MAEQDKVSEIKEEKTPIEQTETAPVLDKTESTPLDAEEAIDTLDEVLMILNVIDQERGGKGEITEIPEALQGSLNALIEDLKFVRGVFEDPLWEAILDDMADQKEDGKTPSVEVAIARNIPLENIQGLAESEDYEGVQNELTSSMAAKKQSEEEEVELGAGFEESMKALDEYVATMGYDEERKNALAQTALDLFKIVADGKIMGAEWEKIDKMQNYDGDMADMIAQIPSDKVKEVLPDKSSVDAAPVAKEPTRSAPVTGPGMSSMNAYNTPTVDVTQIGSRKRK